MGCQLKIARRMIPLCLFTCLVTYLTSPASKLRRNSRVPQKGRPHAFGSADVEIGDEMVGQGDTNSHGHFPLHTCLPLTSRVSTLILFLKDEKTDVVRLLNQPPWIGVGNGQFYLVIKEGQLWNQALLRSDTQQRFKSPFNVDLSSSVFENDVYEHVDLCPWHGWVG
jgi:hypothetical protein